MLGGEEAQVAPLVCALTGYIAREARRLAAYCPGGRLDPPLSLRLDEAALICPVPLHQWSADMGGRGVSIVACFQSRAQLIDRYGDAKAATFLNNAGAQGPVRRHRRPRRPDVLVDAGGGAGRADHHDRPARPGGVPHHPPRAGAGARAAGEPPRGTGGGVPPGHAAGDRPRRAGVAAPRRAHLAPPRRPHRPRCAPGSPGCGWRCGRGYAAACARSRRRGAGPPGGWASCGAASPGGLPACGFG